MKSILKCIGMLALVSCTQDAIKVSTSGAISGDLTYINGTSELGIGKEKSGTANAYLDCSVASLAFFPRVLSRVVVAFGGAAPGTHCNFCTLKYSCSPGETVSFTYSVPNATSPATPAEYDLIAGGGLTIVNSTAVCPSDGKLAIADNPGGGQYQKVEANGVLGIDTEHLKCF